VAAWFGSVERLHEVMAADEDEIAFTRVWLAIQEAGRMEPRVGAAVAWGGDAARA